MKQLLEKVIAPVINKQGARLFYTGNDYEWITNLLFLCQGCNAKLTIATDDFFEHTFYIGYEDYYEVVSLEALHGQCFDVIVLDGIDGIHGLGGVLALQQLAKCIRFSADGMVLAHNVGSSLPSILSSIKGIIADMDKEALSKSYPLYHELVVGARADTSVWKLLEQNKDVLYEESCELCQLSEAAARFQEREQQRRYRAVVRKQEKERLKQEIARSEKEQIEAQANQIKGDKGAKKEEAVPNKLSLLQRIMKAVKGQEVNEQKGKEELAGQQEASTSPAVLEGKRWNQLLADLDMEQEERSLFDIYYNYSIFIRNLTYPLTKEEEEVARVMEENKQKLFVESKDVLQGRISILLYCDVPDKAWLATLSSALCQCYDNYEILIGTREPDVVRQAVENMELPSDLEREELVKRLHYSQIEEELSLAAAYNTMERQASGDYLAFLVGGVIWYPEYLTIVNATMEKHGEAGAMYAAQFLMKGKKRFKLHFSAYTMAIMENKNETSISTFVCRREYVTRYGLFQTELPLLQFYNDFMVRFTRIAPIVSLPVVLSEQPNKLFRLEKALAEPRPEIYKELKNDSLDEQIRIQMMIQDDQYEQMTINQALVQKNSSARRLILPELVDADINGYSIYHYCQRRQYPKTKRQTAIIIPSYEALECLRICIETIERYTPEYIDYEVILVDNCSSGITIAYLKWLEKNKDYVKVIYNEHNMGYTYAVNQGIKAAREGSDYLLLNNDAFLTEGWLDALYEVKDKVPKAGLIVPRQQLLPHRNTIVKDVPGSDGYRETDVNLSFRHRNVVDITKYAKEQFVQLNFAAFFLVLITNECYQKLGLLDEEQGRHYESDTLYCAKAKEQGIEMVYTPYSKVYHLWRRATRHLKQKDEELFQIIVKNNGWDDVE